jgi:Holliday junction resolvasome RuvABC DNA-binding subunit
LSPQPKNAGQEEKAPAQAAVEAVKEAEVAEDAETYSHEWLIGAPNAVGYKPDDIAGALSAVSKKNLTIEETQDAVKAWLRAPVKEA